MTWTLESFETGYTVGIPNGELGDTWRKERRQASGETEGGRLFVQDLRVTDEFLEASWSGITRCDRDAMLSFAEDVRYRARSFKLSITGGGVQVPEGAGGAWSGRVRLDQSQFVFRTVIGDSTGDGGRERFEVTARFRVVPLAEVLVQDVIQVIDRISLGGDVSMTLPVDMVTTADAAGVELS